MTGENRRENARAEVHKGRQALAAADVLLEAGLYDDCVSRLYYAAFHFAAAALLALGIEARTHAGLSSQFAQHLVKPGLIGSGASRKLAALLGLRQQADYNRHFEMDEPGAREERRRAGELIDELETYLRDQGVLGPA